MEDGDLSFTLDLMHKKLPVPYFLWGERNCVLKVWTKPHNIQISESWFQVLTEPYTSEGR